MKKLIYILSFFVAILMFESCSKEAVVPSVESDPFAMDDNGRGLIEQGAGDGVLGGGVIDEDNDQDEDEESESADGGGVVDEDNDQDEDEDDDDDRESDQGM
jgi:hypothetical protein